MPTRPNNSPFAARENATGKPKSSNKNNVTNMMGAKFAVKNSIMENSYPW
jgi:hypothetical protein